MSLAAFPNPNVSAGEMTTHIISTQNGHNLAMYKVYHFSEQYKVLIATLFVQIGIFSFLKL